MDTRIPRVGDIDILQHLLKQSKDEVIHGEIVRPIFQHESGSHDCWIFGAIAELLDNVVDEIPHGATKVLIDTIPNPCDRSPSLLIQDDGGGMGPSVLWNCMNDACPQRKPPKSIGENGEGFKAGVSCLGANVIVFTRCINTRMPTQSIGFLSHVVQDTKCKKHIRGLMVHYRYNPTTGGIIRYECQPEQFSNNMSTLLRLSPYNSEEELLQNFNDMGPHGTKIIVFNLSRNNQGNLKLDFDTNKKDIRINEAKMPTQHKGLEAKNSLVYQYRKSLRAYLSILYLRLPEHFKIVLRGEVVKRRNIAAELKHRLRITGRHQITGMEDNVVLGLLDGVNNDGMDRFCFYHKNRLILAFLPLWRSAHKGWSIVGVLQAERLKPANNKQDFIWSDDIRVLQNTLKAMTIRFWKHLRERLYENTEPALQLTLAPPGSHDAKKLKASSDTGLHSQVNSSAPAHDQVAAPSFQPSYGDGMPSCSVQGAPPPSTLPPLPGAAERDGQLRLMGTVIALYHAGTSSNRSSVHSTALPSGSNYCPGIQGAPASRPPAFPTANTMSALAPSRALPSLADTTALGDLPIKMERDGVVNTSVDSAYPVPGGVVPAAAETKAAVVTSDATPSSSTAAVSLRVAEAHLAESSAIINGGASSSHQEQKPHGSSNNQRGQGANLLPNQGRPMVTTVKIERP